MDNKNYPLVSVIIPMYNAEKFIGECIDSARRQEYRNWEMFVVDNCSTDKSRDIVLEYAKNDFRIKLISLESNSGSPARPRNIGIKNANGKYVALLDADDLWLERKLSKQVAFLEQHEDTFLLYSRYQIWKNGKIINKIAPAMKKMKSGKIFSSLFLFGNFISCATVIFRNRYKNNYLFDEDSSLMEDFDLWLRISRHENISFIDEPLIIYRVHHSSTSADIPVFFSKYLTFLKKWKKEVSPNMMYMRYLLLFFQISCLGLRKIKDSFYKEVLWRYNG